MFLSQFKAILYKEYAQEMQGKYVLNAMLMFSLLLIAVVVFPFSTSEIKPEIKNILYWVILYFSAINGLNQSFVNEVHKQTVISLKINFSPMAVFFGKMSFNLIALWFSMAVITFIYSQLFLFDMKHLGLIFGVLGLASIGIAFAGTLLSALIAQVSQHGSLFAIIGFPVLFPVFIIGINATESIVLYGSLTVEQWLQLGVYDTFAICLSLLVFDYIWDHL